MEQILIMSKYNRGTTKAPITGAVKTKNTTRKVTNHNGAVGFKRGAKSELFLSAATSFVQPKFYETESELRARQRKLVAKVAVDDPQWMLDFLTWLRVGGNMRTGALVLAADAVKARLDVKADNAGGWNRKMIRAVLKRADEPGEMLAYWHSTYGRKVPQPVKRGIADAAEAMYGERNWIKYDSDSAAFGFADVIELTHPEIQVPYLAKFILDEGHGHKRSSVGADRDGLAMIAANRKLREGAPYKPSELDAAKLAAAGMTWEALPSLVKGGWTGELWDKMIPSMGVMALIRNLNNFDQYGISEESYELVVRKITDPGLVAGSRILPLRAITAYRNAAADRWKHPLAKMLDLTLSNIPALPGRTLILVDISASMRARLSIKGTTSYADAAAVFGAAVAKRAKDATLVAYNTSYRLVDAKPGESVLQTAERITRQVGGGTDTVGAIKATFKGHDRVILLTDEQYGGYYYTRSGGWSVPDPGSALDASVPLITFNLAGYAPAQAESGPNRVTLTGLSDSAWALLDSWGNMSDKWPWEK